MKQHPESEEHWLARPQTIRQSWIVFIAILVLTVLAQVFIKVKGYFGVDGLFGFGAAFGFLCCAAMVVLARLLGPILKRDDRYYDD